ncbi:adenylate cyclase [Lewinella aquimaris]|uniref:Adenylate cyclase n=1 Tax=Neolewinella aquimaris TaxID=1835722 RepID=A0A840E821_9BACT|nr:adenylate/guanylate cyclase domain-containing protein [Neolewinella aquimaris]MBB4079437.1 adenylate cyclase [Neolewinella aquimaris]
MLDPKTRRQMVRLLPFGAIWLLSAVVFLLDEWTAFGGHFPTSDGVIVPDAEILAFALVAMAVFGMVVGHIELSVVSGLFAGTSFARKLVAKLILYFLLIQGIVLLAYPIAASMEHDTTPLDPLVWRKLTTYVTSYAYINSALQLAVTIGLSILYAQFSDLVGHTTFLQYLAGSYHAPREETRVFMFVDMRSSTAIAEGLGHERYFRLLKDYYADLAPAVVDHGGEVYLYVGDEMILSWKLRDGLHRNNCLSCFFAMESLLADRAAWYTAEYGVVPNFKAGLHCGQVTTGEIGVLKRHIMFTGDVLNTTARLQDLCNFFGVKLLVSAPLLEALPVTPDFATRSVGHQELRGRKQSLEVFTVTKTGISDKVTS